MIVLETASPDETKALAARLATLARPGDLVVLAGELGTGKTAFAQGFAAGLGVLEPVTSPTFMLVQSYDGRLVMNHVDVYRLERLDELSDLALSELIDGEGVTVIEWGDVVRAALPPDYLEVRLSFPDDDADHDGGDDIVPAARRRIEVRPVGRGWQLRRDAVLALVEAWRC